ncbi:hypothetical protein DID96_28495 [Burkholderia sp. Bp8963]|uniref:hypothetical protein n=1 Tax=Burkholderia sp. Bp8963 TaxID=2184547 RepID=UPI000F5AC658|nr:hypothetical protein [Burkholderia sp. Bp8963]RQS64270.1 hypothetical protein DID96_28495 [Burkholderia sp. Bp8963]
MNEPTVNTEAVPVLIEGAEGKIREFQAKVERIDARVQQLEADREAVEALLEYVKEAAQRKSVLTGLFVHDFEYGSADPVHPEIVDQYEKRLARRLASIKQLKLLREQRVLAIEFAQKDVERLKKIHGVHPWPTYLESAGEDV